MSEDWHGEMRDRLRAVTGWEGGSGLPVAIPRHWLSLAREDYRDCRRDERGIPFDPILAQALPSARENHFLPSDSRDPLGESSHRVSSRLVHQYPSRLLVRATGECPLFCRHCYRRSLLGGERSWMDEESLAALPGYIKDHPEIREVLVSGGDPLSGSNQRLADLFGRIRQGGRDIVIRLCTRAPVSLPSRVDEELIALLRRNKPLKLILHVNHPWEISAPFLKATEALQASGIPLRSQSVLLKGINDDEETLAELFSSLSRQGVEPYYLFQGDLAAGTAHFRVPLSKGLELYRRLRLRLSGLELPRYAVDAPSGGGKLYLPESVLGLEAGYWILKGPDGKRHRYPEEA